jgi:DinB superfamily
VLAAPSWSPPSTRRSLPISSGWTGKARADKIACLFDHKARRARSMPLPAAIESLWDELQAVRQEILKEVEGLSQAQFDWRPGAQDWSVGEIIHHLILSEVASGKLTTKMLREAEASGTLRPYPEDAADFLRLPRRTTPGPVQAPPHISPEHGRPVADLLEELRVVRERSRKSIDRLGAIDPRPLTWMHVVLGEVNLAQAWTIILANDRDHINQIRAVKASPGFPDG